MIPLTDPADAKAAPVEIAGGPDGRITVEIVPQGIPDPADTVSLPDPSDAFPEGTA